MSASQGKQCTAGDDSGSTEQWPDPAKRWSVAQRHDLSGDELTYGNEHLGYPCFMCRSLQNIVPLKSAQFPLQQKHSKEPEAANAPENSEWQHRSGKMVDDVPASYLIPGELWWLGGRLHPSEPDRQPQTLQWSPGGVSAQPAQQAQSFQLNIHDKCLVVRFDES